MLLARQGDRSNEVRFGQGFVAQEYDAGTAILDIDTGGVPVQVELIQVLGWLHRTRGIAVDPPTPADLGTDANAVSYDPAVDCMMVRLFPGAPVRGPFSNREVPLSLMVDYGGRLCGLRLTLDKREVDAISARANNALDE